MRKTNIRLTNDIAEARVFPDETKMLEYGNKIQAKLRQTRPRTYWVYGEGWAPDIVIVLFTGQGEKTYIAR